MKKIFKLFSAIKLIIQRPALLNLILKDEQFMQAQFERSNPAFQLKEIDLFKLWNVQKISITPYAFLSGSSLATDFALLKILCKQYEVERYFEIGTWRGESAANVAKHVQEVYTLNLPDETLRQMGQSAAYIASHRHYSKDISNIKHLFGDSATFDFQPFLSQFDLIFIDGDHSTKAVERDTKTALSLRRSEASIMVWHDAKSDAEYPRYEVLQGIMDGLPKHMHQNVYLVKHTLCAVYLPDEIQYKLIHINEVPSREFTITIEQQ